LIQQGTAGHIEPEELDMRPSSLVPDEAAPSKVRAEIDAASSVPFGADLVHLDGRAVLMVRGEVDLTTAGRLRSSIEAALAAAPRVELDLHQVVFMDSSGVRVLIQTFQQATQSGEVLELLDPSPCVQRLMSITGLDRLLPIRPTAAADGQHAS